MKSNFHPAVTDIPAGARLHRLGVAMGDLRVFVVAWHEYNEELQCLCRAWRPIGRKCDVWERLAAADDDRPLQNIVAVIKARLDEALPLDS